MSLTRAEQGAAVIEVKDLVKRYRKAPTNAVDGISFQVNQGELFCLLGPNGAGKTTTISILTTTLSATSGSVRICGLDLAQEAAAVRRQVGIIFQQPSLDLNLSAEENVRLHAMLYGIYPWRPLFRLMPAEYRQRVLELSDVVGLGADLGRPVKSFSGGMRRKLEIVRTLIHRPRVLFLDEPTTGLAPESRRNLWAYLHQVQRDTGTTVLLTTHYLEETEGSDRICILDRGRIVALGTPEEVTERLVRPSLILDAVDRAGLGSELRGLQLRVEGTGPFRIELDAGAAQRIIGGLRTELTQLRTQGGSVEEAYLALVGREEEAI
ncbi:ATP-binding cassette domain-containing protein [Candidatus Dormiibacter inghamiae]|uniref:ATP-binding cassette domain-containing protein n=1 Tax=Candidatus Dormiibacter inghamiae TaxID=3127013 RepID=UPI0030C69D84